MTFSAIAWVGSLRCEHVKNETDLEPRWPNQLRWGKPTQVDFRIRHFFWRAPFLLPLYGGVDLSTRSRKIPLKSIVFFGLGSFIHDLPSGNKHVILLACVSVKMGHTYDWLFWVEKSMEWIKHLAWNDTPVSGHQRICVMLWGYPGIQCWRNPYSG